MKCILNQCTIVRISQCRLFSGITRDAGTGGAGGAVAPPCLLLGGGRSALWVLKYTWQIVCKLFHMV